MEDPAKDLKDAEELEKFAIRLYDLHERTIADQHMTQPLPWSVADTETRNRFRVMAAKTRHTDWVSPRKRSRAVTYVDAGPDWNIQAVEDGLGDHAAEIMVADPYNRAAFFSTSEDVRLLEDALYNLRTHLAYMEEKKRAAVLAAQGKKREVPE